MPGEVFPPRRILLARHGETAWNALGKLQGHTDIALNDTGRGQARALAASLAGAGIRTVWASDLGRARETAEIVAAALGLPPPAIEPALRERRFGVFEGLTREECAAQHPEAWHAWHVRTATPPGAEERERAVERLGGALARIAERGDGPAFVVSHGGVMRLWLMELFDPHQGPIGNGATFVLDHDGRRFRVAPR